MLNPALSAVALLLLLTALEAQTVTVRLVGVANPQEGRLEVNYNGTWGTVCDHWFNDAAASVVCYSLGFGYDGRKTSIDIYGIGNGTIWLDDIECNGTERHIVECSHKGWGVHDCTHDDDVAISCQPATTTTSVSSSSPPATVGGLPATGNPPTTPVFSSSSLDAVDGPRATSTTPLSSSSLPATVGGPPTTGNRITPVFSSPSVASDGGPPATTTSVSSSSSPATVDDPRATGYPITPVFSSSSLASVGSPPATTTTTVSSSSSLAAETSVSDSPINNTTSPSTRPPTSTDNSPASVERGNDYAIMIIVVVGLVALMIFFCIAMTYCYCCRNRMREVREQPAFTMQETSSDINRPPPTASVPDDPPPPYSSRPSTLARN